ncbi:MULTISPECIES: hypothetical protein [Burkholderia]|uniref:hypothetical protein n=1 Tax=Burkholderia TaxID=32008 RepID=UPI000F538B46|nr:MULTISPECIES: hypothetical protein [Burkholderia]RQM57140.1 hypothetical protein EHZ18_15660 [Burkholderia vietnamiensis]HDR9009518.1 hypothetical protein [Burkholderia vietnamiensis]HDR9015497.1 hypothetical protein [Burkholderia vietnamiensis]HDR9215134.1 hypothetical protein [Burkholderia vietnamiensis]
MTVVRWFFRVAHFAGGNARFSGNQRPEMGAVTRRRGGLSAMKFREGGTNGSAAAGAARQPHLADVRRLAARRNAISRADEAASGVASPQQID